MILNETPGVYATQGGGGTGDSRINVRGFDQRNVAVLINGVPVNDMENGQVYWSNWDLGDVTKSLQVQRGLSASKIAVPSVGGTINVLTKGFDDKRRCWPASKPAPTTTANTRSCSARGQLKGDWAVTVYGSRRTADGWVDKAFDDAWTYFGTVSKRMGKHSLSLTGLGSPQKPRPAHPSPSRWACTPTRKPASWAPTRQRAATAASSYNPDWGYLDRYTPGCRTATRVSRRPGGGQRAHQLLPQAPGQPQRLLERDRPAVYLHGAVCLLGHGRRLQRPAGNSSTIALDALRARPIPEGLRRQLPANVQGPIGPSGRPRSS